MAAFEDFTKPEEIKEYLLSVLSRTGGRKKDSLFLYHYTSIETITSIVTNGYIWLGSTKKMNDYLEDNFIGSTHEGNQVFFACFSKVEENLAMYKMYAPAPNGAMMAVTYEMAQDIIRNAPASESATPKDKVLRIVRDNVLTDEEIEAEVFWAAVAYKDLHSDMLKAETVTNSHIKNPLNVKDLAGFVKLYGWEYEKEVRLVAVTHRSLADNEKVAMKLPDDFSEHILVVTGPGYDRDEYKSYKATLKRMEVDIHESEYDGLVDLGQANKNKSENIEDLDIGYLGGVFDDFFEDGYHKKTDLDGNVLEEGTYKDGELIDGVIYNVVLIVTKEKPGIYRNDECEDYEIDEEEAGSLNYIEYCEYKRIVETCVPVRYDEIERVDFTYCEYGIFSEPSYLMGRTEFIARVGLEFFYVADKKVKNTDRQSEPEYINYRTLERFLSEEVPGELERIRASNRKYNENP